MEAAFSAPAPKISSTERCLKAISDLQEQQLEKGALYEKLDSQLDQLDKKVHSLYKYINNQSDPSHLDNFNQCLKKITSCVAKFKNENSAAKAAVISGKCRDICDYLNKLKPGIVKFPDELTANTQVSSEQKRLELRLAELKKRIHNITIASSEHDWAAIANQIYFLARNPQAKFDIENIIEQLYVKFNSFLTKNTHSIPIIPNDGDVWKTLIGLQSIFQKPSAACCGLIVSLLTHLRSEAPYFAYKTLIEGLHLLPPAKKREALNLLKKNFQHFAADLSNDVILNRKLITELSRTYNQIVIQHITPQVNAPPKETPLSQDEVFIIREIIAVLKRVSKIYPEKNHPIFRLISNVTIDCENGSFNTKYYKLLDARTSSDTIRSYINLSLNNNPLLDATGKIPIKHDAEATKLSLEIANRFDPPKVQKEDYTLEQLVNMYRFAMEHNKKLETFIIPNIEAHLKRLGRSDRREWIEILMQVNNELNSTPLRMIALNFLTQDFLSIVPFNMQTNSVMMERAYEYALYMDHVGKIVQSINDPYSLNYIYTELMSYFKAKESNIPGIENIQLTELGVALKIAEKLEPKPKDLDSRLETIFVTLIKKNSEHLFDRLRKILPKVSPQNNIPEESSKVELDADLADFVDIGRNKSNMFTLNITKSELSKHRISTSLVEKWAHYIGVVIKYR